jgi:hypothetical protein
MFGADTGPAPTFGVPDAGTGAAWAGATAGDWAVTVTRLGRGLARFAVTEMAGSWPLWAGAGDATDVAAGGEGVSVAGVVWANNLVGTRVFNAATTTRLRNAFDTDAPTVAIDIAVPDA